MKNALAQKSTLIVSIVMLVPAMSFASQFTKLKAPTNKNVAAAYSVMQKIDGSYFGAYQVTKPTQAPKGAAMPLAPETVHQKAIAEAMHKYMCSFFDDGVSMSKDANSEKGVDQALKDLDVDSNIVDDNAKKEIDSLRTTLNKAVTDKTVEMYSGTASGNNTGGFVMGMYDTKNKEVVYFGFTNCGSDD